MSQQDKFWIDHMLEAIAFIERHKPQGEFYSLEKDELRFMALVKQIEIIGEASANLSEELKQKLPHIPWREIKNMRNYLVHEYFAIDLDILEETIREDIPYLKQHLKDL